MSETKLCAKITNTFISPSLLIIIIISILSFSACDNPQGQAGRPGFACGEEDKCIFLEWICDDIPDCGEAGETKHTTYDEFACYENGK